MKNKNFINNQLVSSKELSQRVGYTNDYISRLCRFGKIEGEKIGNAWYVDELSLKKFIEGQENQNKDWNGELSKKRKIEYQGNKSIQSENPGNPFLKFGRITVTLGVFIVVAGISTAFGMANSTMQSLLAPAQVTMRASTQSAASILSGASDLFTQASSSAVDGVKTAFTSLFRTVSPSKNATSSPLLPDTDSKPVAVKNITNSPLPSVNKINNTQSTPSAALLGINTSATINGALRVSGSSVLSSNVNVGGSATVNGALQVSGSSVLSSNVNVGGSATVNGALQVSGSSVLSDRLEALGGIDTNNTDINAGSGRVFASNIVNGITAGENVSITGTPQNPIISSLAASSVVNNITEVTEIREIRIGGGGGSRVTSVEMSVPSFLTVSGSPITSAGVFDVTYSGVALPLANGGTGLSSIADAAILATNADNVLTAVTAGASQSIRRNAGNTAWEAYTPSAGGSGTVGSGTVGQFPYYAANGTTIIATSSLFLATNGNIGIGTTTPGSLLSLGDTGANTINLSAIATSTFGSGVNILTGCFSVNGTCLPTSSGTVTSLAATYPLLATGSTGAVTISTAFGTTTANSFNQLQTFNAGILSLASSTIGNGAGNGGLTINGGATTTGASYFVGNIGVGIQPSNRALDVSGTTRLSSTLTLQNIASCSGSSALQTDGSGNVSCGSIASLGVTTAGGWSTDSLGNVTLATTTDRVAVGATTTPYAKLTVLSGATGTTTVALVPVIGQTANIIDIYNTSGALSSVFTSAGRFGIGTTTPGSLLSLGDTGANTINLSTTATSTFGSGLSIRTGCFAINGSCLSAAGLGGLTAVTGTWPIISSGGTTPNITFDGLSTSTAAVVGNIPYFSGANTFANVATSTLALGTGLTSSGTLGYQIGGTNSSISFAAIAANSLWANATGGSAVPTAIATSSLGIAIGDTTGTLAVSRGGTGQTSFAQGWLHSNGTTLTSSTSPTVNYITATSTTATSTFAGGVRVTGGGVTINTLDCSAYLNSGKLTIGASGSITCSDDNGGAGGGISTYLGLTDTPSSYTANAIQYANPGATALTQSTNLTFDGAKFSTLAASTTLLSAHQAWFGSTATSSFSSTGALTLVTPLLPGSGGTGLSTIADAAVLVTNSANTITALTATGGQSIRRNAGNTAWEAFTAAEGGSGTVGTGTTGQFPYYSSNGTSITATSSLFLATSGNVGVGTTTPQWLLNPTSATGAQLSLSAGAGVAQWALRNAGGNLYFASTTIAGTATTTTSALTILNNGNIGIGTTTPGSLLSLGDTGANTINLSTTATSTFGSGLSIRTGCFAINGSCLSAAGLGGLTAVTGTWPIISSGGTTPNITFDGLSTSTAAVVGNIPYFSGANTFANVATSTLALGTGLTSSGTLGYQIGGTNSSISFAAIAANSLWANATGGSAVPTAIATSSLGIAIGDTTGTLQVGRGGTGLSTIADAAVLVTNSANTITALTATGGQSIRRNAGNTAWEAFTAAEGGSGTVGTGTTGQFPYYSSNGTSITATSSLFLATSGNVGVGTTTPYSRFSVWGAGTGTGGLFSLINNASSTVMQVLDNGNVGVGTTTPGSMLSVAGAGYFAGNLNLDSFSSYQLGGQTVLSATSTTFNTLVGILAGNSVVSTSTDTTSGTYNTALGYEALRYATSTDFNTAVGFQTLRMYSSGSVGNSGSYNTAVGHQSLFNNSTGSNNTALGSSALVSNTSGASNVAVGSATLGYNTTGSGNVASGWNTLNFNITGSFNIATGLYALYNNISGSNNIASGYNSLFYNLSATSTTAIGTSAAAGTAAYNNQGGVYLGYQSGYSAGNNSDYNTLVGYQSGYNITTGSNNIWIGTATSSTAIANLTTGSQNILIGNNISLPSATDSGQLNIGNIIYGTSITGTGSTLSTGNIGIGTTSPATLFEVGGSTANVTLGGYLNCTGFTSNANGLVACTASDQRLKQNVVSLDGSSGLAAINALNPVSFYWKPETERSTQQQYGFIAQQVQSVFPNLVVTSSPTTLTPDGTLSVNYEGFISPMIRAIQELDAKFLISQATTTLPSSVLTVDGKSIDLYKLATYSVSEIAGFAARMDAQEVRMTSLETRIAALEGGAVSTSSGTAILSTSTLVSALDSFGVLIQKGVAQFNTLVFRQLVASTDADGTSSAGSVTILAGNTVAQVNNSLVLPSTKIFVTFNSQLTGNWWVSEKSSGSFRVVLSGPQVADVSFDYFLVQTEGQIATSTPHSAPTVTQSNGPDTVSPTIILLGDNPVRVSIGGAFVDPGITVTDNVDSTVPYITFVNGVEQPVSSIDTGSETTYIITYSATDTAGNFSTATRSVIVGDTTITTASSTPPASELPTESLSADTVAPVVTLIGAAAMQINVGDVFTDPGATAVDDTDGDLTANIIVTGAVDTAVAGLYTLTYSVIDVAGNTGTVSRAVTVSAAASSNPITIADIAS